MHKMYKLQTRANSYAHLTVLVNHFVCLYVPLSLAVLRCLSLVRVLCRLGGRGASVRGALPIAGRECRWHRGSLGRAARVPRARVRWQPARTTSRERLRAQQPRLHGPVLPAARNALSQGAHHR